MRLYSILGQINEKQYLKETTDRIYEQEFGLL